MATNALRNTASFRYAELPPKEALASAVETLIAILDVLDGDPDIELNGDELDHNEGEDEFINHRCSGPGCPVSDPGGGNVEDEGQQGAGEVMPIYGIDQTKLIHPSIPGRILS